MVLSIRHKTARIELNGGYQQLKEVQIIEKGLRPSRKWPETNSWTVLSPPTSMAIFWRVSGRDSQHGGLSDGSGGKGGSAKIAATSRWMWLSHKQRREKEPPVIESRKKKKKGKEKRKRIETHCLADCDTWCLLEIFLNIRCTHFSKKIYLED